MHEKYSIFSRYPHLSSLKVSRTALNIVTGYKSNNLALDETMLSYLETPMVLGVVIKLRTTWLPNKRLLCYSIFGRSGDGKGPSVYALTFNWILYLMFNFQNQF